MLLGMFHAMTENYMIEVVTPLGGDSSSVGIALFVATFVETFVIVFFDQIRSRILDTWLLKIAGLSFLLKSVLLLIAPNVTAIYCSAAGNFLFLPVAHADVLRQWEDRGGRYGQGSGIHHSILYAGLCLRKLFRRHSCCSGLI